MQVFSVTVPYRVQKTHSKEQDLKNVNVSRFTEKSDLPMMKKRY